MANAELMSRCEAAFSKKTAPQALHNSAFRIPNSEFVNGKLHSQY